MRHVNKILIVSVYCGQLSDPMRRNAGINKQNQYCELGYSRWTFFLISTITKSLMLPTRTKKE